VQFVRLDIAGFKSFPEPCSIPFTPELTAIVGPNGCGKSNIIDALRWIMGETTPRHIRGGDMDDVIFAGTQARPARNIAEVSLVLDNIDHKKTSFPIKQKKLTLTRSIERDKGSTWQCQSHELRSKDVRLLFADLATSARSHMIIAQGDVTQLINSTPQQRKRHLEEAADTSGLHIRRSQTEQKLQATEKNLIRLKDTMSEIQRQKKELERQAQHAQRYSTIQTLIYQNEKDYLLQQWQRIEASLAQKKQHVLDNEQKRNDLTEQHQQLQKACDDLKPHIDEARLEEEQAREELEECSLNLKLLDSQQAQQHEQAQNAQQRKKELEQDRQHLDNQRIDIEQALHKEQQILDQSQKSSTTGASAKQTAALLTQRDQLKAQLDEHKRTHLQQQQAYARYQAHVDNNETTLRDLDARLKHLQTQLNAVTEQQKKQGNLKSHEQALQRCQGETQRAHQHTESCSQQHHELKAQYQGIIEQERLLKQLRDTSEHSDTEDAPSPLSSVLDIDKGYEQAVIAAFDDSLHDSTTQDASPHWRDPFDASSFQQDPPLPDGVASLLQHVRAPAYLARKLNNVGIVDSYEQAYESHKQLLPGQRLVTKDGACVRWDGLCKKHATKSTGAWFKNQQEQWQKCQTTKKQLEAQQAQQEKAFKEAQQRLRQCQQEEQRAQSALQQAQKAWQQNIGTQQHLEQTMQTLLQEQKACQQSGRALQQKPIHPSNEAEMQQTETAYLDIENQLRERQQQEHMQAQRQKDALASIQAWQKRQHTISEHLKEIDQRLATHKQPSTISDKDLDSKRRALQKDKQRLEKHYHTSQQQRQDLQDEYHQQESDLKEVRGQLKAMQDTMPNQDDIQPILEEKKRLEQELQLTYQLDPHSLSQKQPSQNKHDLRDIDKLKRQREAIGSVNLLAEKELAVLSARLTTLENEHQDLLTTINKLQRAIKQLRQESQKRIDEAFRHTNKHFKELFATMFGGGTAYLELTDARSSAESGLEIYAHPPGKKMRRLSLLSGGEKALAALCLIFALFLTHPPPICILDEADAALDEANTQKLCALLQRLTHQFDTRFLIITHSPITMHAMKRLYGITMNEAGVSQMIPVNLQQAEALAEQTTSRAS